MSTALRVSLRRLVSPGSALLLAFPLAAAAQAPGQDSLVPGTTVRVAVGPEYDAGFVHRFFFGSRYRELWATPIDVQVLDLDAYAGGLAGHRKGRRGADQIPSPAGRGRQGVQLPLGEQGSVGRPPAGAAGDRRRRRRPRPDQRGPPRRRPHRGADPGGHRGAPRRAAPGGASRDSSRLGQFTAEFGGMLGTIEERPEEAAAAAGFAGADDIISTEKLLEELRQSPNDRVDARAYLAARLQDIYLGDWDRHRDQWRWARFGNEKPRQWVPIPRDRDQALARYDGFLLSFARVKHAAAGAVRTQVRGDAGPDLERPGHRSLVPHRAGAAGLGFDRPRPPGQADRLGHRRRGSRDAAGLSVARFGLARPRPPRAAGPPARSRRSVLPPPRRRGGCRGDRQGRARDGDPARWPVHLDCRGPGGEGRHRGRALVRAAFRS